MKHDERMNYLFIEENEFDTQIYRIFRPKYFFEMLEDKKMAMMKPELWDDPRENPLKRARFECEDGEGSFAFADDLFCVCWSQCKESGEPTPQKMIILWFRLLLVNYYAH